VHLLVINNRLTLKMRGATIKIICKRFGFLNSIESKNRVEELPFILFPVSVWWCFSCSYSTVVIIHRDTINLIHIACSDSWHQYVTFLSRNSKYFRKYKYSIYGLWVHRVNVHMREFLNDLLLISVIYLHPK
jgi:hypothetical protein